MLYNNKVAAIYSNVDLKRLQQLVNEGLGTSFLPDNPVFFGSVDFHGGCKTFTVADHVLLGLGSAGDIYMYGLRSLSEETTSYRIEARVAHVTSCSRAHPDAYGGHRNVVPRARIINKSGYPVKTKAFSTENRIRIFS